MSYEWGWWAKKKPDDTNIRHSCEAWREISYNWAKEFGQHKKQYNSVWNVASVGSGNTVVIQCNKYLNAGNHAFCQGCWWAPLAGDVEHGKNAMSSTTTVTMPLSTVWMSLVTMTMLLIDGVQTLGCLLSELRSVTACRGRCARGEPLTTICQIVMAKVFKDHLMALTWLVTTILAQFICTLGEYRVVKLTGHSWKS